MPRTKISTTVYFTLDQAVALRAISVKTGVPQAALVRRALDNFISAATRDGVVSSDDLGAVSVAGPGDRFAAREESLEQTVERVVRRLLLAPKQSAQKMGSER